VNQAVDLSTILAVEMAEMAATATSVDSPVKVSWRTSAELDNLGFYIYRAEREDSRSSWELSSAPLNEVLIPSRGTPARGADYVFTDATPVGSGEVAYFLFDVDTSGRETLHGPIDVTIKRLATTQATLDGGKLPAASSDGRSPSSNLTMGGSR
jgi:hypothetical protein